MFEKTFESLLKGLDPKSDPKTVFPAPRKIDAQSRGLQYYNGEKEFIQLASEVDAQMRARVTQLALTKNPVQPFLNEVFIRKPKRQVDKSALNEEARTGFLDMFTRMNTFWDQSESKRTAASLFNIKGEGDKDGSTAASHPTEDRANKKNLLLRVVSKDSAMTEDANSPLYDPAKPSARKSFGSHLTVEPTLKGRISGEPTPVGLNKEDSLDTSANFTMFKPPQSLTQIIASRETLDKDEFDKEEEQKIEERRIQKAAEKNAQNKLERENREKEKEKEREMQEEEETQKKVDVWMKGLPDFNFVFAKEVVEHKPVL